MSLESQSFTDLDLVLGVLNDFFKRHHVGEIVHHEGRQYRFMHIGDHEGFVYPGDFSGCLIRALQYFEEIYEPPIYNTVNEVTSFSPAQRQEIADMIQQVLNRMAVR